MTRTDRPIDLVRISSRAATARAHGHYRTAARLSRLVAQYVPHDDDRAFFLQLAAQDEADAERWHQRRPIP